MRHVVKTDYRQVGVVLLGGLARVALVGVFLLWGAFFVEHLQEWFIAPLPNLPPLRVWLGQGLHLFMLIGLLASLRWPRVGAVWVAVSAFAFLHDKAGARFPVFFGMTMGPVLLLLFCRWLARRVRRGNPVQPANT